MRSYEHLNTPQTNERCDIMEDECVLYRYYIPYDNEYTIISIDSTNKELVVQVPCEVVPEIEYI